MGIDCASKLSGIAVMHDKKLIFSEQYKSDLPPNASDTELARALSHFKINLITLIQQFKPDHIVIELTGVTRNANTMRLLCYFEAAAILAARDTAVFVERIRTTSARKKVFGNGLIPKTEVAEKIIKKYGEMSMDEADAVVFCLAGCGITL